MHSFRNHRGDSILIEGRSVVQVAHVDPRTKTAVLHVYKPRGVLAKELGRQPRSAMKSLACEERLIDMKIPVTAEWIMSLGFEPVQSDDGPGFEPHYRLGQMTVCQCDDSNLWCLRDADYVEAESRRDFLHLMKLCGVKRQA